jgi:hypothetical protein
MHHGVLRFENSTCPCADPNGAIVTPIRAINDAVISAADHWRGVGVLRPAADYDNVAPAVRPPAPLE